jgi:hypothetical protein
MHSFTRTDSRSPPSSDRTITRATIGPARATAQPSLTSGFGSVMEQEHDLQSSTEGYLGAENGPHSNAIDRILRNQQLRLGDNIGLLEDRYEMLPHPARFHVLRGRPSPLTKSRRATVAPESAGVLPNLVAQHLNVLGKLTTLIAHSSHGDHGELILNEVARNHEEMAWRLTALLKEDESAREREHIPVVAAATGPTVGTAEGTWENKGGAPSSSPAPDAATLQLQRKNEGGAP